MVDSDKTREQLTGSKQGNEIGKTDSDRRKTPATAWTSYGHMKKVEKQDYCVSTFHLLENKLLLEARSTLYSSIILTQRRNEFISCDVTL